MTENHIQDEFLRVFAAGHRATASRILEKIDELLIPSEKAEEIRQIVMDELRGLYHGNLVVFDGGSNLADYGLIKIVNEDGDAFDQNLHEICFTHYDEPDTQQHRRP